MTYHVLTQIFLLLSLEPLQILQYACARILDITLRHSDCLLKLEKRLLGLSQLISPCSLRVLICDTLNGMRYSSKEFVDHAARGGRSLVMLRRGRSRLGCRV